MIFWFRYHIKYQLVGDHLRERISTHLQNLRPALQKRLKFIIPVTMDESKAQHHHATDSSGWVCINQYK